jgi:hypothetical protein
MLAGTTKRCDHEPVNGHISEVRSYSMKVRSKVTMDTTVL